MHFSLRSTISIRILVLTLISTFLLSGVFFRGVTTHAANASHQTVTKGILTPSTTMVPPDASATVPRGIHRIHVGNGQNAQIPAVDGPLTTDTGTLLENFNGTSSL